MNTDDEIYAAHWRVAELETKAEMENAVKKYDVAITMHEESKATITVSKYGNPMVTIFADRLCLGAHFRPSELREFAAKAIEAADEAEKIKGA